MRLPVIYQPEPLLTKRLITKLIDEQHDFAKTFLEAAARRYQLGGVAAAANEAVRPRSCLDCLL